MGLSSWSNVVHPEGPRRASLPAASFGPSMPSPLARDNGLPVAAHPGMSATAVHLDPRQDHGLRDPASRQPGDLVRSDSLSFSVVVCTVGRVEPLRRLLASLERQTVPVAEIIVVDQNQT